VHFHVFPNLESDAARIVFVVGSVFWVMALLQMIWIGQKQKTSAMPFLAICTNITFQFYLAFVCPYTNCAMCPYGGCAPAGVSYGLKMGLVWAWGSWFLLTLVLLWQLIRYGKDQPQEFQYPSRAFYPLLVVFLILFYTYQATYTAFYSDWKGNVGPFESNLLMSAAFVFLLFARPDMRGLSYGAAWTKMLGTGLQEVSIAMNPEAAIPGHETFGMVYVVFIFTTFFDLLYIILLTQKRRETAISQPA
jgi:hypothetical protein